MCEAVLYDEGRGRACARATAWLFPARDDGPVQDDSPLPHTPEDGVHKEPPASWSGGYLDSVDWRWVQGAVTEPGPGMVWMRPLVDLVEGEPMSPVQRLMACVDSASGVSAALDPATWAFLNTELTVHVLRPPVGEWVCLDAGHDARPAAAWASPRPRSTTAAGSSRAVSQALLVRSAEVPQHPPVRRSRSTP